MKVVEEFGRTVEDARDKAFRALGIADDDQDAEVEVLDEGSPGNASGWGRKFARIKVTLRREEPEEVEAPAAEILEEILELMRVQASVEEDTVDGQPYLNIVGPDNGLLIGKHGQTLDALQYVLNLIINHGLTERTRVTVDVGGYRRRRERTLRELAERMAQRVVDEGRLIALEPMNPGERRIIHMALAEDPDVETYSEGEEPSRKVIIAPRK